MRSKERGSEMRKSKRDELEEEEERMNRGVLRVEKKMTIRGLLCSFIPLSRSQKDTRMYTCIQW